MGYGLGFIKVLGDKGLSLDSSPPPNVSSSHPEQQFLSSGGPRP